MRGKPGEVYNIGADDEVSNLALARQLLVLFKKEESAIAHINDRPGHDRRYAIDARKIKRKLGWKPHRRFASAFEPTVEWYRKNVQWVKRALAHSGAANMHIV